jgi:Family of unknown function (DUF5681)
MTSRKNKSTSYEIGYGKPPRHAQFRQGRSGNPGGRPRHRATERVKELALQEAYRPITVKEGGRALALPAIQAILRSQVELAAQGNVQAQRAVLAVIQTIEAENVFEATLATVRDLPAEVLAGISTTEQDNMEAVAPATRPRSYTEAAQRIRVLLRLDEEKEERDSETDKTAADAAPSGATDASGAKPGAAYSQVG